MRKFLGLIVVFCCMCSGTLRAEINIPHLTGGVSNWQDVITIDNLSDHVDAFRIILYRKGEQSFSKDYEISPYSSLTVNVKDVDSLADCGVILTSDTDLSCFRCRVAYHCDNGGVAEFTLNSYNKSQLSFNFANTFKDIVQWKGIAVMNSGFKPQDVTLYALGKGKVLGVAYDSIAPRSKILGNYTTWFPEVGINDIESIIVTSLNAPLAGVTISGNLASSKLLFTPAKLATKFKDLNNPDMQLAKRLIGSLTFVEVFESFTNQQSFMIPRISSFNSQNDTYELLTLPFWQPTAKNIKTEYKAGQKLYTLQYEYQVSEEQYNTIKYSFTFVNDFFIEGNTNTYNSQGELIGKGMLFGQLSGTIFNNNGDEDLSLDVRKGTQSFMPFLNFK